MEHKKYRNLIDEYFFGEINSRDRIKLEEHLKELQSMPHGVLFRKAS